MENSVNDTIIRKINSQLSQVVVVPRHSEYMFIDRVLQSLPPSYKSFVMNYNMQGMDKTIPELFAMLKDAKVEIKKEHQVLMVNKTTNFKKRGKGKKGNFKNNGKQVAAQVKKPKYGSKPENDCFYYKGNGHWKWNGPKYLAEKKDGKVKGIFDIHVIDVYLTNARSSVWVFDTGLLLIFATRNRGYKLNEDWLRMR